MTELGKVVNITAGFGFKQKEYSKEGIRLLRINNVSFGDIVWNKVEYLPNAYATEYADLNLKKNDIVIALNRPLLGGRLKIGMMKLKDCQRFYIKELGKLVQTIIK